jgi:hypothetical protein
VLREKKRLRYEKNKYLRTSESKMRSLNARSITKMRQL